jgi:hypothetical protein
MKKTFFFLVACHFNIFQVLSQSTASNLSLDLKAGASFPVGEFAKKTYTEIRDANGLAKPGIGLELGLNYSISKKFGLQLTGGYSFNKQDPDAFSNYVNQGANNPQKVNVGTNDWDIGKILGGISYKIINSRLSYHAGLSAGFCKTSVPAYYWAAYASSGLFTSGTIGSKMSLPWSFCFQTDFGATYSLGAKTYCLISVYYFNSSASGEMASLTYHLNSINALGGIGYKF